MSKGRIFILIATVILCFAGFNNKYPLLTMNSGTYINAGLSNHYPYSGSYFYGLFIKHTSWASSLWLTIFCQAFIIAILLYFIFKYHIKNSFYLYYYVSFVILISFFLSATFTISTIDPGVFSSAEILCLFLLLFTEKIKRQNLFAIVFLLFLSTTIEINNLLTGSLIIIVCFVIFPFHKKVGLLPNRLFLVALTIAISGLTVSSINKMLTGEFSPAPKIAVQMLPRFNSCGLLKKNDNSDIYNNQFINKDISDTIFSSNCMYKDPFLTVKDVDQYENLSNAIINQPHFIFNMSTCILKDFTNELISNEMKTQLVIKDSITVLKSVFNYYNEEVREVYLGRQIGNYMNIEARDNVQQLLILLSSIFTILVFYKKKYTIVIFLFTSIIFFSFTNAVLYGTSHLQWHYTWLIPIPTFIYLGQFEKISQLKKWMKNTINN